ncbi:MAG: GAF domain-containing protein [Chloroflexota bacterium]
MLDAHDGLSGVNMAIAEQPDLVLMDINMPGLDGYEASTLLRGLPDIAEVPIVAYTALVMTDDDYERLLAAGCDGYISKSVSPQELVEEIEAYLQGKHSPLDEAQRNAGVRAYQQRLVERLQDQINKLTRANEDLMLMNNVAQAINSTLNMDEMINHLTQLIVENLDAQVCSILLLNARDELVYKAVTGGESENLLDLRLDLGQGFPSIVAQTGQPLLNNDVRNNPGFVSEIDQRLGIQTRSILSVPLHVKGRVIGVIEVRNKIEGEFDDDSLQLLNSLASTAALTIENANLYRDLQDERDTLIKKEEEIRRSIARDLHDGPTQMLSAISMNVDFIKKLRHKAPDKVPDELANLQRLSNEAAREVRALLFGLHPTVLETQGLIAALEVLVERSQDLYGVKLVLNVQSAAEPMLSKMAQIEAFIIVQEAVNNARKHANSPEIFITLWETPKSVVITVQDHGVGFNLVDVTGDDQRISFGLMTMPERARLVGAKFDIQSAPGQGTTVTLEIPFDPEATA